MLLILNCMVEAEVVLRPVLVFLLLLLPAQSFGSRPVENGGFNSCTPNSISPWQIQSNGHAVSIDNDTKMEGCGGLRLASDDARSGSVVQQSVNPSLLSDDLYVFSGYIKTSDIQTSATLFVIVQGADETLFQDDMRDRQVRGTTDWQKFRITLPRLAAATNIKVGVVVIGSGTAWFDDLRIRPAELARGTSPLVSEFLSEVLSTLETRHINRNSIDWESIRRASFAAAEGMQTIEQAYSAARVAIQMLDDGHSFLIPDTGGALDRPEGGKIRGHHIKPGIGYIAIDRFEGDSNGLQAREFARRGQKLIHDLETAGTCAWIVDLRQNSGGNMWPMIAAVGPLLGGGIVGAFEGAESNERVE